MSDQPSVLIERDGEVAVITLNRPEKLNAVGPSTLEELRQREAEARDDPSIRAVVLTGKGRAFSAGADLSPEAQAQQKPDSRPLRERFPLREDTGWPVGWFGLNIPKPVIAAVNGAAVGWGAEMLATCDYRIGGQSARIGWVFAKRGLTTDMGVGPIILPRLMPISQAARLLFSGNVVNADEAHRIGLLDELVPDDQLMTRAVEIAKDMAGGAPNSIAVHKRELYETLRRNPYDIYFEALDEFQKAMASEDFKEGVASFLEKRPPRWTGR